MKKIRPTDDYTPQEAQARFEATLRGALKTPPQPRPTKKAPASGSSAATGESGQPRSES